VYSLYNFYEIGRICSTFQDEFAQGVKNLWGFYVGGEFVRAL